MADENNTSDLNRTETAGVMERNIKELIKLRQAEEKQKTRDEHLADKITSFTGKMAFVYIQLVLFVLYLIWNAGLTSIKPVDPEFSGLGTIASVEAIFLSTFVLIRQNRMNKLAEKRDNLDLQVSLLAEHEITRILTLVSAIGRKLEIEEANDHNYDDLTTEITPEKVLDTIEKHQQNINSENEIEF
jgi:uncharacterized membrane protein